MICCNTVCSICVFTDTATTEIYTDLHTLSLHDSLPIEDVAGGQRREHRVHRRLAHLAALARAVASDELAEGADAGDPHDVEQLGAGHGEVAAEVAHDGAPRCGEALVDELLEDREARPASGAGLGARPYRRHLLVAGFHRSAESQVGTGVVSTGRTRRYTET